MSQTIEPSTAGSQWPCKRLRFVTSASQKREVRLLPPETEVTFVPMEAVGEFGGLDTSRSCSLADVSEGFTYFRNDDTVIAKITPCFENGKGALAENLRNGIGFGTTELHVLRPMSCIVPRFLFYATLTHDFRKLGEAEMYGAGGQKRVPEAFVRNFRLAIPPLDQQRTIVAYLDRETLAIDELVDKKERMIGLLREKRLAFISHMVTHGLDSSVPVKPSRVPPVGDIPAHWGVERAKVLFSEIDERADNSQEELLTVSHLTGVTPRSEKPDVTMFMADSLEGYKRCKKNDLVINTMWAWMGALGFTSYDGVVSPSYNVYRLKRHIIPKFLDYLLKTPQYITEITRWSKGVWTSRLRLYPEAFFQIRIPVPPLEEQIRIVEAIEAETGQYEKAILALNQSCERLTEYRAGLITATVTGKIAVTEAGQNKSRKRSANVYFKRAVLAAEILRQLRQQPELGQIKLQKAIHLCEHHAQLLEVEGNYVRDAAGPHDNRMMRSIEARLAEANWFRAVKRSDGFGTEYVPLAAAGQHTRYFEAYWSGKKGRIQEVIDLLRPMKTQQAEIVATLYAVWNDLILDSRVVTDEAILHEVLTRWHEQKTKISQERWLSALEWMRKKGLVPTGFGKPTRIRTT